MIDYLKSKIFLNANNKVFSSNFLNKKLSDAGDWSMKYKEGVTLYNLCKELKPFTVLEIGTYQGYSSGYMLTALKELGRGFLYTINRQHDFKDNHIMANNLLSTISNNFELIIGNSDEVKWDKFIDLLFVDGGHDYEIVLGDLKKYVPFVNDGGLILCHDHGNGLNNCGRAIDKFFINNNNFFTILLNDSEFSNWLFIAYKIK